jgi:hypothetical protein
MLFLERFVQGISERLYLVVRLLVAVIVEVKLRKQEKPSCFSCYKVFTVEVTKDYVLLEVRVDLYSH